MTKKWKLSDSGLQVYEGSKHIATVHYGGNPIVDVTEAIENATLIRQAPAMETELAALRAERDELKEALETIADPKNWLNQNGEIVWNDFEGDEFIVEHAQEIARAVLAKYEKE